MHRRVCKQYIFHSYNIYFQWYVFWWKSFYMTEQKIRQKQLRVSDFALLLVIFKWHHGSEGVKDPVVHVRVWWRTEASEQPSMN